MKQKGYDQLLVRNTLFPVKGRLGCFAGQLWKNVTMEEKVKWALVDRMRAVR